jgi:TRAP-type uncharacterized transport system substrate-binding protein
MSWFSTKNFKEYGVDTLGVDRAFGVVLVTGWNTHPNFMSEDEVYKLLKTMISKKDELVKVSKNFSDFTEDPVGLQVTAISTAPEIPVHIANSISPIVQLFTLTILFDHVTES